MAIEEDMLVWESADSGKVIRRVKQGDVVVAAGNPDLVESYTMVPIEPHGAVQWQLFQVVVIDPGAI